MKRALITGATGFIGSHLTEALLKSGWQVVALTRRAVKPVLPNIVVVTADLANPDSLIRAVSHAGSLNAIFHLAARLPGNDDAHVAAFLSENGVATATLLEASLDSDCQCFVYASTMGVVGRPLIEPIHEDHPVSFRHSYFLGKFAGEIACLLESKRMRTVAMRIASPYGPGMAENSVLPRWVDQALRGDALEVWGQGTRAQDFIHVSDVVKGLMLAASNAPPGVYNLGSGKATTMAELAQAVVRAVGGGNAIRSALRPDPEEGVRWRLDLSRSMAMLGFHPDMEFEHGLLEYAAWRRGLYEWRPWWDKGI